MVGNSHSLTLTVGNYHIPTRSETLTPAQRAVKAHQSHCCRALPPSLMYDSSERKEKHMSFRAVVLAVGLALFSVAVSGAESAIIGTWKQVLSKSKYQPGPAPAMASTV